MKHYAVSLTEWHGKAVSFPPGLLVALLLAGVLVGCSMPVLIQEEQPEVSSSPNQSFVKCVE